MTATKTTHPAKTVDNGVNVTALLGAREALANAPQAAQFKWRASCEWLNGTHSRSAIGTFYGLGSEQQRGKTFAIEADHPQVFASEDNAPTPVELVLSGLASCLTAGIAAVAQHRGIQIHSIKASLEADMDLYGILGIDADVRNGFGAVRVNFDIKADASEADIKALVAQSQKRSAVFDIVTNPTAVFVTVNGP
ncbi:OsmC family protein [Aestuariivirga sp.]|uniref:OsmC family protein n=1 Tax=Aestuariivirga sp. TaxID=2650926 RepID=UPI0039E288FE